MNNTVLTSTMEFFNAIDEKPPFSWRLYQKIGSYFSKLIFPTFTIKEASETTNYLDILMFKSVENRTIPNLKKMSQIYSIK